MTPLQTWTIWVCPECNGFWTYDHGPDHESWVKDADGVGAACMASPEPRVVIDLEEAVKRMAEDGYNLWVSGKDAPDWEHVLPEIQSQWLDDARVALLTKQAPS